MAMSDFFARFYPGDTAAVGVAAVLLQITVVIALAAATVRVAKRRAALRHAVWLTALGCVLVSPLVAVLAGRLGAGLVRIESPRARPPIVDEPMGPWAGPLTAPPRMARPTKQPHRARTAKRQSRRLRRTPWPRPHPNNQRLYRHRLFPKSPKQSSKSVLGVPSAAPWSLAGPSAAPSCCCDCFMGFAAWPACGVRPGRWTRHERRRCWNQFVGPGRREIAADPDLAATPGPAAVGVLHPFVLLPEGMTEALDDRPLRDVLIHECAHLSRRDPLVGLLQRLVGALFWPHPLLIVLNRRLAQAREEVCDDYVLRTGDAPAYARTLLTLALGGVRLPMSAPGLIDPNWKLENRVAGLLDPRRTPMTRVPRGPSPDSRPPCWRFAPPAPWFAREANPPRTKSPRRRRRERPNPHRTLPRRPSKASWWTRTASRSPVPSSTSSATSRLPKRRPRTPPPTAPSACSSIKVSPNVRSSRLLLKTVRGKGSTKMRISPILRRRKRVLS